MISLIDETGKDMECYTYHECKADHHLSHLMRVTCEYLIKFHQDLFLKVDLFPFHHTYVSL